MATTTASVVGARILTEMLAPRVLDAAKSKSIIGNFANFYSIAGQPTTTLKLSQFTRLSPAVEVATTDDITDGTSATLGYTANQSIVPAENAVNFALITDDAIELAFPGEEDVATKLSRLSDQAKVDFLAPYAARLMPTVAEKIETDFATALTTFSTSVGSTGVDITPLNLEEAIYALEALETLHEDYVMALAHRQVSDIRRAMSLTSGGYAGFAHRDIDQRHRDMANGFKFNFLGVDVFQIAPGVQQTANSGADVVGAIFLVGSGDPEVSGTGQPGALAFVEGRSPYFEAERDASARMTELIVNHKYEVAVRSATGGWGVKIVTDA